MTLNWRELEHFKKLSIEPKSGVYTLEVKGERGTDLGMKWGWEKA